MTTIPYYDTLRPTEKALCDRIPNAVAAGDDNAILSALKELYLNDENKNCGAALGIVEKYLFRAYELLYFAEAEVQEDVSAFFFDEETHSRILDAALSRLDPEEGKKAFADAIVAISALRYEEAGCYFRKSALAGDPNGAFNYGITLSRGDGIEKDDLEASFWFWFAACRDHEKACTTLALNYRKSEGVLKDGVNMIYWYVRAALLGSNDGLLAAASCLAQGIGLPDLRELGTSMLSAAMKMQDRNNARLIGEMLCGLREMLEPYVYNR